MQCVYRFDLFGCALSRWLYRILCAAILLFDNLQFVLWSDIPLVISHKMIAPGDIYPSALRSTIHVAKHCQQLWEESTNKSASFDNCFLCFSTSLHHAMFVFWCCVSFQNCLWNFIVVTHFRKFTLFVSIKSFWVRHFSGGGLPFPCSPFEAHWSGGLFTLSLDNLLTWDSFKPMIWLVIACSVLTITCGRTIGENLK